MKDFSGSRIALLYKSIIVVSAIFFLLVLSASINLFKVFNAWMVFAQAGQFALFSVCACFTAEMVRRSVFKPATMGFSFAFFSHALGGLYLVFYHMVKGNRADYPSIADFGFLGFFFLLTGVLGFFKQLDSEDTKAQKKDYISFAVVLCILFSGFEISLHKVMDFAYALITGWTLFLSCQLMRLPYYKDLLRGVFAVCLINIIMISSKGFWADATLVLRSAMPFAISLLMYGIYKNNGDES